NVDADASRFIRDQPTESLLSEIGHTLTYDDRDSRLNPTEGLVLSLGNDLAGIGGTEYFARTNVSAGYYIPVGDILDWSDVWVLSLSGRAGYIVGLGEDVRINERFFLGGENMRGFASAGASPRDINTDDALGANWITTGSVQMQVPLGLPEEFGIAGRVFSDFGTTGKPDEFDETLINAAQSLRLSVGGGITWTSPLGPISVDLGWAVLKEDYDEDEVFRLTFGSRF
ncbi:MAG: BamA/TamA family outer membrane protein, partial [Rhodospirillaceae bacterium]